MFEAYLALSECQGPQTDVGDFQTRLSKKVIFSFAFDRNGSHSDSLVWLIKLLLCVYPDMIQRHKIALI